MTSTAYTGDIAKGWATRSHHPNLACQIYPALGKCIADLAGKDGVVLDIGAGAGQWDIEAAKNGCRVLAGDLSLDMAKYVMEGKWKASGDGLTVWPCLLDGLRLPVPEASVDVVVAREVLFLFDVGVAPVAQQVREVLKPGGVFLTSTSSAGGTGITDESCEADDVYDGILSQHAWQGSHPGIDMKKVSDEDIMGILGTDKPDQKCLEFDYEESLGWFLDRLEQRYTYPQKYVPTDVHSKAMAAVHDHMRREYDEDYMDRPKSATWTETLTIFRPV